MYERFMTRPQRKYRAVTLEHLPPDMTPSERIVMVFLWWREAAGGATRQDVYDIAGVSGRTMDRAWSALRRRGMIRPV